MPTPSAVPDAANIDPHTPPTAVADVAVPAPATTRSFDSAASRQFATCFGDHVIPIGALSLAAQDRLLNNQPVDPNHPSNWRHRDAHAQAVLLRHGITGIGAE